MKSSEVIYQTPTGESAKGYIINGRTYKDREGTTRVDVGSTVPTSGGTYTLTAAGSVLTPSSIGDEMKKGFSSAAGQLASSRDAAISGIKSATDRKLANIEDQRGKADDRYADANRRAYHAYLSASNPYGAAGEQAARLGLADSGYAESSKLKLASGYQSELSENARQKAEYLDELDHAYRDAVYDGDIQRASAIADYEKLVYQHGIAAAEAIANQQMSAYTSGISANESMWARKDAERAYKDSREDEMWKREMEMRKYNAARGDEAYDRARYERQYRDEKKQQLLTYVERLVKMGLTDEEIAASMGITTDGLYGYLWELMQ